MEIRLNAEWGTVCDSGFDEKAGNIVCKNLGYGSVKRILGRAGYGRGIGTIHLTQLRCVGMQIVLIEIMSSSLLYGSAILMLSYAGTAV